MSAEHKCDKCNCHVPITLRDLFWQDPFFSENWDDFGRLHEKMLQETRNFWGVFDRQLKDLESGTEPDGKKEEAPAKEEVTPAKEEEDSWFFPRRLMRLPSLFNEERTKDWMIKDDQVPIL
jgi:hypothetical protein